MLKKCFCHPAVNKFSIFSVLALIGILIVFPFSCKDKEEMGVASEQTNPSSPPPSQPTIPLENWELIEPPQIGSVWRLRAVAFVSENLGWAVGFDADSTKGVVLQYNNGKVENVFMPYAGKQWTVHLSDIALTGPDSGWAVGDKYYIWADPDRFKPFGVRLSGGRWSIVSMPTPNMQSSDLVAVSAVPGTGEVFAVGGANSKMIRQGLIMKYAGGWSIVSNPVVNSNWWELKDVAFSPSGNGWAVGRAVHPSGEENALIVLAYRNGRWYQEEVPTEKGIKKGLLTVCAPSSDLAWAGGTGVLLKYANGKWQKENFSPEIENWTIRSIHFSNPQNGWAVGWDEARKKPLWLKYSGGNWQRVKTKWDEKLEELNGVFFLKPGLGFAVGGVSLKGSSPGAFLIYRSQ